MKEHKRRSIPQVSTLSIFASPIETFSLDLLFQYRLWDRLSEESSVFCNVYRRIQSFVVASVVLSFGLGSFWSSLGNHLSRSPRGAENSAHRSENGRGVWLGMKNSVVLAARFPLSAWYGDRGQVSNFPLTGEVLFYTELFLILRFLEKIILWCQFWRTRT